jgi:alpha-tubulin suppressor-like RCC1 family protein
VINSSATPAKVTGLSKHRIVKIEAKASSAAITASGELYVWGVGVYGTFKTP